MNATGTSRRDMRQPFANFRYACAVAISLATLTSAIAATLLQAVLCTEIVA